MKVPALAIASLFLVSMLVAPVLAIDSMKTHDLISVTDYYLTADEGDVIYEILVDPVPMGRNQTHTLTYKGVTYTLSVGTRQQWLDHYFDLGMTYPNGTTIWKNSVWTGISSGSYKLDIQPIYYHAQSLNPTFAVYVNVGLEPLKTEFNTQSHDFLGGDPFSSMIMPADAIPFTDVSGTLGAETNVFVYTMSEPDFLANVEAYNPFGGISEVSSTVTSWLITQAVNLVNNIPVIGPLVVTILSVIGAVVGEIAYWLVFVIYNAPRIIAGGEVAIAIAATLKAKAKDDGTQIVTLWLQYNIACIKGFVIAIDYAWNWTRSAVEMISGVIGAIGKLLGL
jgi:hypothetical protein